VRSNYPVINVYKKNNIKSGVVTQLLYGDTFKKVKESGSWFKIKNDSDNYKGYIKKNNFPSNQKNTHKVYNLYANLYSSPFTKSKIKKKLSFGSKIKVLKKEGNFYKFDYFWINKKDLKKINYKTKNIFKNIKKFINIKYKWGGNILVELIVRGLFNYFSIIITNSVLEMPKIKSNILKKKLN